MKRVPRLRSIGVRLMALVMIVILATVLVMVWQWARVDRQQLLTEKTRSARTIASTLGRILMNEIDDANWSQIRVDINLLMSDEPEIAYVSSTPIRRSRRSSPPRRTSSTSSTSPTSRRSR